MPTIKGSVSIYPLSASKQMDSRTYLWRIACFSDEFAPSMFQVYLSISILKSIYIYPSIYGIFDLVCQLHGCWIAGILSPLFRLGFLFQHDRLMFSLFYQACSLSSILSGSSATFSSAPISLSDISYRFSFVQSTEFVRCQLFQIALICSFKFSR